ncbi:GINS complex subunit 2 [Nematocida minor]|uniref:GINS complex subunit 2 n=1 Tax=Nematocida minor TaxID=1912983 RepID=UPI0022201E82|nr:GINS complex subunit 2 [Nematocida minor]KAI5190086.1 GINS complex subunit 2 [Nematocida minor]
MAHGLLRSSDDLNGNIDKRIKREREAEIMLAQSERVTIVPRVHMDKLEMASGTFGPFFPMAPASVPLYVALFLRHSLLCSIQAPEWLSIGYLQRAIENEEISLDEFSPINMYIFENAEVSLESCDITENISEIKILIKKLKEIRLKKLLKGIEYIDTSVIGMNNLTFYEFRKIKEYIIPHLEIQKNLSK